MQRKILTTTITLITCSQGFASDETLTGDSGGRRTKLSEKGVDFSLTYTAEVYGNPVGGAKRGAVYNGLLDLSLDIDLEKIAGWSGGKFHVGALYPHGTSGTQKFVGELSTFSNIDYYDSTRLYELWLQQNLLEDRISLRAGQLDIDEDFASSDFGGLFPNSAFGNSSAFSANLPESTYATLALGARLKIEPFAGAHASFAIYDGNAATALGDPSPDAAASTDFNKHNLNWALRGDEGALLACEIGYAFHQPEESAEAPADGAKGSNHQTVTAPRALGGSYKAGVIHHTDTFSKTFDVQLADLGSSLARTQPRGARGNTVLYLVADQEVWREPGSTDDGLGVFARAAFAQTDRNFLSHAWEVGAVYRGLWQTDAADQLGLGFAFLDVSKRIADATLAANHRDGTHFTKPDYEAVVELTYQFHVTPWATMQPDAQWIIHPGGSRDIDNALVIGFRTEIAF